MKFVRRSDWGAPATSPAAYIGSTRGTKVHYLGDGYTSRHHTGCDDKIRQIRAAHLADEEQGWVDIAYNLLVCEHGYVYEGRGAHKKTGANGSAELNAAHYAVCALLGSSGLTKPTNPMLDGLRDAIEYLRSIGAAGGEIKGHRDGWATACPGDPLYAWVRAGAPRPTEDDMPITDDDVKKIWKSDNVVPNGNPETKENNPFIPAATSLSYTEAVVRRSEEKVEALAAKVAAQDAKLDAKLDAILAKLSA